MTEVQARNESAIRDLIGVSRTVLNAIDDLREAQNQLMRSCTSSSKLSTESFGTRRVKLPRDSSHYKLFASEVVEDGAGLDPDFIELYESRGSPVLIGPASDQSVSVGLIR
jgi:hypothetical protein